MFWVKSLGLLTLLLGIQIIPLKITAQESILRKEELEHNSTNFCPQDLSEAIPAIINRPELSRSRWGIEVQTLNRHRTLYSLEGDKFFIPASSAKLLTTAAALLELGADYRIVTPIYGVGNLPNLSSLRLEGRGDPTISTESLKDIVRQLQTVGFKRIEKLIVDDSYFPQPIINPTWEWLDVYSYYATSVNSLILNQNTVTLTLLPQQIGKPVKFTWSDAIAARQWQVENNALTAPKDTKYDIEIDGVLGEPILQIRGELAVNHQPDIWDLAILNPANYFLESWRSLLTQENIIVNRGLVVTESNINNQLETELAKIVSLPLSEIITKINQESNNLYAESLRQILKKQLNQDTAIDAVETSLTELGINSKDYNLVDGSGLSRHNLVTPKTLVETLRLIWHSPQGKIYRDSLAVAGTSGTLKIRFRNTFIQGKLWGKTGTLTGVNTLTGYLDLPQYETIVFSIMVNNSDLSSKELRQAIDEIVMLFSQVKNC